MVHTRLDETVLHIAVMQSEARPQLPENSASPENVSWPRVKALFEEGCRLQGEERDQFLDRACEGNSTLRMELESLLENHTEDADFLDEPVAMVPQLLEDERFASSEPESQVGARVGAYRLEQSIGRGGMGEVYLATRADREFDQRVAIKLVRNDAENALAISRFRLERQILAQLENAYIARLLDGGTTAAGLPYFIMEYVEGQPINQYCTTSSLTIRDRLHLFLKVCSAVQYAHERNIIHRDLKPGNILVKADGTPKLLDFGIAKIFDASGGADPNATQQTSRMLTPAYASPEQLRGGTATVASDIFSLGVVLYEMVCGRRPDEVCLHPSSAASVQTHEAQLSPHLRTIVLHAIHIDPDARYPAVKSFAADIRLYLSGSSFQANTPEAISEATRKISLAILPFRVIGAQGTPNAFLAPGITETLITKLSRIERLSIPPPSSVLRYAEGVEAVRVANELHVAYVLEGSLHFSGSGVRANVQLVFAETGMAVWAGQIEAIETALLKLEDSIAEQVAYAVLPHLTGEERAALVSSGTNNSAAHTAYLRGRWHWLNSSGDPEKLLQALLCFSNAIDLDPNFARAHAGIADYYLRVGLWGGLPPVESFAAAVKSAETAVSLEPALGEAHASLGFAIWAYSRDEETAEREFSLAILRSPNYASAHHWFGLLNSARDRPELAIANLERARSLDPNSTMIAAALGFVHYNARQYDAAMRILTAAARELPQFGIVREMTAWCCLQIGDKTAALEHARESVRLSNRSSASLSALAHAEAVRGNKGAVVSLREEVEKRAQTMYVSGYDRASLALAAGEVEDAIRFLADAQKNRDWWFCWIGVDPRWDRLRSDSRFRRLLKNGDQSGQQTKSVGRYLAFAGVMAVLVFAIVWYLSRPSALPFGNVKFTKLTTNGTAEDAVVSLDGKTLAYAAHDGGESTIWRRDLSTSQTVPLVRSLAGKLDNLDFTNQGAAIQFVTFPAKNPGTRSVSIVPLAGGAAIQLDQKFAGPVSINLAGNALASFQSNLDSGTADLFVMPIPSGPRRLLVSFKYPIRFAWNCRPSWSSDGKQIAYALEDRDDKGFLVRLGVVDVATGAHRVIRSPRWQWVQAIRWTRGDAALAVVGQEHESSFEQIWYLPLNGSNGNARRIGNDLDDYFSASLTAGGSEIVAVQSQTLSNIYLAKSDQLSHIGQITPGSGRYFDLAWVPDGRILYASDATGSADLWVMNANGTEERRITSRVGRNYAPSASPDSKSVVFHANRTGNWQIWRADMDGGSPRQISSNAGDGNWPQFTPDGRSVVFHRTGANGLVNLWRIPAQGGRADLLTPALSMHPAVSSNGRIAAWYSDSADRPEWKLAIFGPDGGRPQLVLNPTPNARPDTPIRWMPKNDAISILDYAQSIANIWTIPLDGRSPRQLTFFESGEIFSFDWSRKGNLLCSHGMTSADVVLIRDVDAVKEKK